MTLAPPPGGGCPPLSADDAVAAIILVGFDGYLMQLRDARPDIWFPNHWGLFGGAIEPGEQPLQALARELREELELELSTAHFFARFDFDLGGLGLRRYSRGYYTVPITPAACRRLVLHEGAAMRVFAASDVLQQPRVAPYDEFALYLHRARPRLT